jgi:hypothetical protein
MPSFQQLYLIKSRTQAVCGLGRTDGSRDGVRFVCKKHILNQMAILAPLALTGRLVAASSRSNLVPVKGKNEAGHWALRTMAPDKSHLVSKLDQLLRMVPVEDGASPPPTVDDIAGTRTGACCFGSFSSN